MKEVVVAWGHENVTANHRTTLEITKERHLTPRGDCIIGVRANKSVSELDERIKAWLREGKGVKIEIILPQYGLKDVIFAYGSSGLSFRHRSDIVVRKSDFVCDRTLAIRSNKAARDIDREIVEMLKDPETELLFVIKRI